MRATAEAFDIRLNALDFKDLQNKITRSIIIPQNITFHKTLLDRFISAFKEQANKNPVYETAEVSNIAVLLYASFLLSVPSINSSCL